VIRWVFAEHCSGEMPNQNAINLASGDRYFLKTFGADRSRVAYLL
jgi:hypothetical protein